MTVEEEVKCILQRIAEGKPTNPAEVEMSREFRVRVTAHVLMVRSDANQRAIDALMRRDKANGLRTNA